MKKLSLREIQLYELNLLEKVHHFCEKNNIVYFLAGGTLIGAIRHKGFIPWDDDADIAMPRPDYERFMALREKFYEEYANIAIKGVNDINYPFPFAKVFDLNTMVTISNRKNYFNNVWIDIFPFDGAYSDAKSNKKLYRRMHFYRYFMYFATYKPWTAGRTKFRKIIATIIIHMSELFVKIANPANILDKNARKIPYETAEFVGNIVCGDSFKNPIVKNEIFPLLKKEFEGKLFNVPANYDTYLTQAYGNYMELPPESERTSHNIEAMGDVK